VNKFKFALIAARLVLQTLTYADDAEQTGTVCGEHQSVCQSRGRLPEAATDVTLAISISREEAARTI
jgi:hypothetical protein